VAAQFLGPASVRLGPIPADGASSLNRPLLAETEVQALTERPGGDRTARGTILRPLSNRYVFGATKILPIPKNQALPIRA
jgi:hypothetical protein